MTLQVRVVLVTVGLYGALTVGWAFFSLRQRAAEMRYTPKTTALPAPMRLHSSIKTTNDGHSVERQRGTKGLPLLQPRAVAASSLTSQAPRLPSFAANQTEAGSPMHDKFHNIHVWDCSDSCDCLPLVRDNFVYFHSSYKTTDPSKWPPGWNYFWNEWLTLHPDNTHILWTDETNELLARCIGQSTYAKYQRLGRRLGPIDKVDFSRALYMYKYGGLYHDMDVFPLRNQQELYNHDDYRNTRILLQGRHPEANAQLALEYTFSRRPKEKFWEDMIATVTSFGPDGISLFWEMNQPKDKTTVQVIPWKRVTPVDWDGRGIPEKGHVCSDQLLRKPDEHWKGFTESPCYESLKQADAFIFSSFTASWTNWGQKGKE